MTRPLPRGLSVLMVEDDVALARVMSHWAAWIGATMDSAATGAASLGLAGTKTYDVVLLDLTLPDMEGAAVYAGLVEIQPRLASRTIVLTGGALTATAKAFLLRTRCPVVLKPFELEGLARQIARLEEAAA